MKWKKQVQERGQWMKICRNEVGNDEIEEDDEEDQDEELDLVHLPLLTSMVKLSNNHQFSDEEETITIEGKNCIW